MICKLIANLTHYWLHYCLTAIIQLLTYVKVDMECFWTVKVILTDVEGRSIWLSLLVKVDMECFWTVNVILTDVEGRSIWLSLLFNNTPCLLKHKLTIVLWYNKCMLCSSCHFGPLKPLMLLMDHAKLHDVLTSLPVSHAILPCAVCFATTRRQTMRHVVISVAVNRHLSQSEDVYL